MRKRTVVINKAPQRLSPGMAKLQMRIDNYVPGAGKYKMHKPGSQNVNK